MDLPTKDQVFDKLMKIDPEKHKTVTIDDITIHDNGTVRVKGRFVKGFSGNPKGKAPKKKLKDVDLTPEERKKFGKDAKAALEHLLKTATTRAAVERISNKLMPYQSPRLANVESRSFEEKTITINWSEKEGKLIDITPEDYKIQTEAAKDIIDKIEVKSKNNDKT